MFSAMTGIKWRLHNLRSMCRGGLALLRNMTAGMLSFISVEGSHAIFTGLTEGKRSWSWLPLSSSNREMGIPSEMGDAWANKKRSFVVASPNEQSENSVREAVQAAFKTAVISGAVAAVPTLIGCRVIPWAKANLNHTAQALIISAASIAGFFITADRTILQNARENTMGKYDKTT